MSKLCAIIHNLGLQFSEPQQESDVASFGQPDEDALESTSNFDINNSPPQASFENATQDVSNIFPSQPVSGHAIQNVSDVSSTMMQQAYDLDFNHLLGLRRDVTSPNSSVQMAAVHSTMLTISQMDHVILPPSTHQHSHSTTNRGLDVPYYHPPSSPDNPVLIHVQSYKDEPSQMTHRNSAMANAIAGFPRTLGTIYVQLASHSDLSSTSGLITSGLALIASNSKP
ncbi:hypothetical protein EV363DRAFT_1448934 [Boletus edulis]|nr:hypothetical protein EV363DRAFT_1448934 [Boletus edulis]